MHHFLHKNEVNLLYILWEGYQEPQQTFSNLTRTAGHPALKLIAELNSGSLSCALLQRPRPDKRFHGDPSLLSSEWLLPTIARAASNYFLALMDPGLFFRHMRATEAYTMLENVSCCIKLRSLSNTLLYLNTVNNQALKLPIIDYRKQLKRKTSLEPSFLHKELHRILMNIFFFFQTAPTDSTRKQNKYVKEISSVAQAAYWLTLLHVTLLTDLCGYCSKVKQGFLGNWRQMILPDQVHSFHTA